jgi:hypothetical protein
MENKNNGCIKTKINYALVQDLIILAVKSAIMYHNQSFNPQEITDLMLQIIKIAFKLAKTG